MAKIFAAGVVCWSESQMNELVAMMQQHGLDTMWIRETRALQRRRKEVMLHDSDLVCQVLESCAFSWFAVVVPFKPSGERVISPSLPLQ